MDEDAGASEVTGGADEGVAAPSVPVLIISQLLAPYFNRGLRVHDLPAIFNDHVVDPPTFWIQYTDQVGLMMTHSYDSLYHHSSADSSSTMNGPPLVFLKSRTEAPVFHLEHYGH